MKQLMITTLVAVLGLLTLLSAPVPAVADDRDDRGDRIEARLRGFEEVGSVSTVASGRFRGTINGDSIEYTLSYSGLEGDVRQAHIHLGQRGANGGVSVFLCQTTNNPDPTGRAPTCLQSGMVGGTLEAANVIGPSGQGIAAGEFGELVRAIRAGVTYANVHTTKFPGGEIRGQIRADDD